MELGQDSAARHRPAHHPLHREQLVAIARGSAAEHPFTAADSRFVIVRSVSGTARSRCEDECMANVVATACVRAALAACLAGCANANAGTVTVSDKTPVKTPGSAPLFRIERHGKWGFIDRTGQVVIRPRFDEAGDFFDRRAPVRVGAKWGYISENGAVVIRPQYDSAGLFRDGRAIVSI